jgi:hypothetical protein
MRTRFLFLAPVVAALAACTAPSGSTPQSTVDGLREGYDAAFLAPATHYRALGFCKTGTTITLAKPCADRAVVAKLVAADNIVKDEVAAVQARMVNGAISPTDTALASLQTAMGNATALIAAYVTPIGVK